MPLPQPLPNAPSDAHAKQVQMRRNRCSYRSNVTMTGHDVPMPQPQTPKIISSVNGQKLQPEGRDHQTAIYPEIHLQ